MPETGFPRRHLDSVQALAARLLETRRITIADEALARDLLVGFFDICVRSGLDGVLAELERLFPPLEITDRTALAEHPQLPLALIKMIGEKLDFTDGGPRSAKPRQLADCVVATLALTLVDEPDRSIALADAVRVEVVAAIAGVVDVELAVPKIRETIVATARERCDERYHSAFDKIAAQLDERGLQLIRQPKVSLDAVKAVQQALTEARHALVEKVAGVAIDRARDTLARRDAGAAARIDLPITHRLTPREVAIRRARTVLMTPPAIAYSLFESLTELVQIAWQPIERPVRAYAASQTFAVGDLLDHPKFGRGSVVASVAQRIEVEFPDGRHTLVHVRAK